MPSQSNQIQIGSSHPTQIIAQGVVGQQKGSLHHQLLIQKQVSPHKINVVSQTVTSAPNLALKSSNTVTVTQATIPAVTAATVQPPTGQVQVQLKTIPTPPKSASQAAEPVVVQETDKEANKGQQGEAKETAEKREDSEASPGPPTGGTGSNSHVIQMIPAMDPAKIVEEDVEADWLWVCDWRGCPK